MVIPREVTEMDMSFNKECVELTKIILEQNRIILLTNKTLLEYLAAPAYVVKPKADYL